MTLLPILLPEGYSPLVSVNQKITAGDPIAEGKEKTSEEIINVPRYLGIIPSKISKYLKKNLGDSVSEGEVIGFKKGKLGIGGKKVISNFSGTVVKIDENTGEVYIRTTGSKALESLLSPVDGTVDFCDNTKIVVKTDKEAVVAKESWGDEATGEIEYIEKLDQDKLTSKVENKVLVTENIDKLGLFKAVALNVAGVVSESLDGIDFTELSDKKIKTPITVVESEDLKKILKNKNKKIYLNGKNKSIIII